MSVCRKDIARRLPALLREHSGEPVVNATFNHYLLEFTDLNPERLRDTDGLSALVVAAAGAVGMPGLGPQQQDNAVNRHPVVAVQQGVVGQDVQVLIRRRTRLAVHVNHFSERVAQP